MPRLQKNANPDGYPQCHWVKVDDSSTDIVFVTAKASDPDFQSSGGIFGFIFFTLIKMPMIIVRKILNSPLNGDLSLKFIDSGVEINSSTISRQYDRRRQELQFGITPHPKQNHAARDRAQLSDSLFDCMFFGTNDRFLDAFRCHLMYGNEICHLLSVRTEDEARDFILCLQKAADHAWANRGKPRASSIVLDD
jgi:hypothetical protein